MVLKKDPVLGKRLVRLIDEQEIQARLLDPLAMRLCENEVTLRRPDGSYADNLRQMLDEFGIRNRRSDVARFCAYTLLDGIEFPWSPEKHAIAGKIADNLHVIEAARFRLNPYRANIRIEPVSSNDVTLSSTEFLPCEITMWTEPMATYGDLVIPSLGIMDERYEHPILTSGETTWMSICPMEINTMDTAIRNASGNVLTLGLGLGYFAYMAHLKPDVEHVAVVETDPDAISVFETAILPQFDHPEKIRIIQEDAVRYMMNLPDGKFDYCFEDVWASNADTHLYLRLKGLERRFRRMKIEYWIERQLLQRMIDMAKNLLMMQAMSMADLPVVAPALSQDDAALMAFMENVLADRIIRKPRDVDKLLSHDAMAAIARSYPFGDPALIGSRKES